MIQKQLMIVAGYTERDKQKDQRVKEKRQRNRKLQM